MKFSPYTRETVNINLTPLIDVVFLLLIFFMVSTTFDVTSQLNIRLPTASEQLPEAISDKLNILIDAKGRFFLNTQLVSEQTSRVLLAAVQQALVARNQPVVIQSDAEAPVQSLVTAMDVVNQLGLTQVAIATTRLVE